VAVFLAEVVDACRAGFEDAQPEQTEHGDQGAVRSWLARGRAALSMNLNEPTRSATEEGHR
jgi:hypothetical protein